MQSNCYSSKHFTSIDEKILYISKNEYTEFFKKPNVVGIGLGYRVSGGFRIREKCLNILVSKKISPSNLSSNELIPKYYKGIKTDVCETGFFNQQLLTSRVRPVLGGYSISSSICRQLGSIGCIVMDNLSNYFILSCNHVLTCGNTVQLGTSVIQPSLLDNGKSPRDLIGSLYKFVPLNFSTSTQLNENYVDAALAIIPNKSLVSDNIYMLGKPSNPISPQLDLAVRKAGRTTDITYGYITILGATIIMLITNKQCIFKDQILTTLMSTHGDSGALLVNLQNNSVGLITGGSNTNTVVNPINYVLNSLQVKIITNNDS